MQEKASDNCFDSQPQLLADTHVHPLHVLVNTLSHSTKESAVK